MVIRYDGHSIMLISHGNQPVSDSLTTLPHMLSSFLQRYSFQYALSVLFCPRLSAWGYRDSHVTYLMQEPQHVECAWGQVVVVQSGGVVSYLHEKELSSKLELLYSKSLYLVALNIAASEQARPSIACRNSHYSSIGASLSRCALSVFGI